MKTLPAVRRLLKDAPKTADQAVVLTYDARLMRRKRLETVRGDGFMVDLPEVTNLDDYWGFELEDGMTVQIIAAEEQILVISGPELARYAWHIGNRHTPCQVEAARLLIRADHVLEAMLRGLGATVRAAEEPFTPEKGAYGMGRPMGHDHGPAALFATAQGHAHSHSNGHSHSHSFGHSHGPGHFHVHSHGASHGHDDDGE
jgi:urease accessory protein